jgi:hypothetical protein
VQNERAQSNSFKKTSSSGKDSIRFQKTNDKKKEEAKSKLSGEKNVSQKYLGFLR